MHPLMFLVQASLRWECNRTKLWVWGLAFNDRLLQFSRASTLQDRVDCIDLWVSPIGAWLCTLEYGTAPGMKD